MPYLIFYYMIDHVERPVGSRNRRSLTHVHHALAGEAGRLWLDRPVLGDRHFTGFYCYAAYMLTGETRAVQGQRFRLGAAVQGAGQGRLGGVRSSAA